MTGDELTAVAQAITDAHANKPGLDCAGRLDDAKTIIAAFDAIMAHRAARDAKATAKPAAKATPAPQPDPVPLIETAPPVADVVPPPAVQDGTTDDVPVQPLAKPKGRGKKA